MTKNGEKFMLLEGYKFLEGTVSLCPPNKPVSVGDKVLFKLSQNIFNQGDILDNYRLIIIKISDIESIPDYFDYKHVKMMHTSFIRHVNVKELPDYTRIITITDDGEAYEFSVYGYKFQTTLKKHIKEIHTC